MLKTRNINGKQSFYDSVTGQVQTNIRSVKFLGVADTIVSIVYKDNIPHVFVPQLNLKLYKLEDVVGKMEYMVERVA
jgi:hypothetical protein